MLRKLTLIAAVAVCIDSLPINTNEMRTVDVNDIINDGQAARVLEKGCYIQKHIDNIISMLQKLTPEERTMLNDPNRKEDNELVDIANKLNSLLSLIKQNPKETSVFGALIMEENNLSAFLQQHHPTKKTNKPSNY